MNKSKKIVSEEISLIPEAEFMCDSPIFGSAVGALASPLWSVASSSVILRHKKYPCRTKVQHQLLHIISGQIRST